MLLGAAGGGVWRSVDFTGNNPTWTPMTDYVTRNGQPANGAIDVGCIAVDPLHPQTIYVGTGEANYSTIRGTELAC